MTRMTLLISAALFALAACEDSTPVAPADGAPDLEDVEATMSVYPHSRGDHDDRRGRRLDLRVVVRNPDTGERIDRYTPMGTPFQVTVSTNGVDCAGQFVVTALGATGAPPSVLVRFVPFIVGPAVATNQVTGEILQAVGIDNAWKISASCNGAGRGQFAFDSHEFFVR